MDLREVERSRVLRGEVWRVALDPTVGSEQRKTRPCVVVQRNAANESSPTTIVVPLTGAKQRRLSIVATSIAAGDGGVLKDSVALCNQVRVVDRLRFRNRLGTLTPDTLKAIDLGLRAILALD